MSSNEWQPPDVEQLLEHALPDASPEQRRALLAGYREAVDPWRRPEPQLRPAPTTPQGFRIRVDLQHTKPPVWRRIEVPGDLTLPGLHDVLQAAMGWTDSHLHRFRTGNGRNAPEFVTQIDLDEGDEGMLEDDVRLDQIVAAKGDRLWYDYDFGDSWDHELRVEQVLDDPPATPRCVAGRLACPPEDCGGVWGHHELAAWVRSDYDDAHRPEVFASAAEGRAWLPDGWHPDAFDLEATNELVGAVTAELPPLAEELAWLLDQSRRRGSRDLRDTLAHPASQGPTEVSTEEAARLTEPLRILLEVIGDGVALTGAGYLKPSDVEQIARRTGITEWWIGKVNREDLTWPVAELRALARTLGIATVRKGRIAPTRAVARNADDPQALLRHVVGRLPLGKSAAERDAGWVALAVVGSETRAEQWGERISELMFDLGWRDGTDIYREPPPESPTLDVLRLLAGSMRTGRLPKGVDATVAAAARAAVRV